MTKRRGRVLVGNRLAGLIQQTDDGDFVFEYGSEYLKDPNAEPVSLTLPLRSEPYQSRSMLPFFDGLIPEGWLLEIATKNWKLDPRDRMSLLLATCKDCIGNVSIEAEE